MSRRRSLAFVFLALAVVAAALGARRAARAAESRLEDRLRAAGFTARSVHFSWLGPVRLEALEGAGPGGMRVAVETADVRWTVFGGRDPRSHVSGLRLRNLHVERAPFRAEWPEADFDVLAWRRADGGEHLRLRQEKGGGTVDARWPPATTTDPLLALERLDLGGLAVHWNGDAVLNPGLWSGQVAAARRGGRLETHARLEAEAVRITPPRPLREEHREGVPARMALEWNVVAEGGAYAVNRVWVRLTGLDVAIRGAVRSDPETSLDLSVKGTFELAEAFRTTGLAPPLREARADRFGSAALEVGLRGPLHEAASLVVGPRLKYEPEPEVLAALAYLRGPFQHRPDQSPGLVVDVRDGAPDFVGIDDVPHLFRKALLVSEDAGFWGHAGVDLVEIVAAWAEKEEEGRVRGASTLTQQLVKNLFLTSERSYGRKLKEAALALMVDAAVSKERLLEIYVNIIEWGPRLHGLAPAARHYFGKRPGELTAREMAFLVCLIPNPVRYHEAHTAGRVGPGMGQLIQNLLGKLRSLGALDDEQYEEALAEELQFAPETSS